MTRSLRAELVLVLITLIWGGTFVVIKEGLRDSPPLFFLALRFTAALLVGIVVWIDPLRRVVARGIDRSEVFHGLLLGGLLFVGLGSQTFGLQFTTVAKSSLFTYCYALLIPGLQYLVARKRLVVGNLIGLAVVVAGMYAFTSPESGALNAGDWVTLAGAGVFAFYIVYLDRFSSQDDAVLLTLLQFATTAILALVSSLALERPRVVASAGLLVAIGYLSVAGSVVAVYLMSRFQKETSPTRAVIIYALEPLFAVLFGFLLLGENLGPSQIAGGLTILGGVLISESWALLPGRWNRAPQPRRRRPLAQRNDEQVE